MFQKMFGPLNSPYFSSKFSELISVLGGKGHVVTQGELFYLSLVSEGTVLSL